MISLVPGAVSLVATIFLVGLARKMGDHEDFIHLLPLIIPVSVGLIDGFSTPIIGIAVSLALISAASRFSGESKLLEWLGFLLGGLVFALVGFRVQFVQVALSGKYVYFTWLSIPITMSWLLVISRSVEFVHHEMGQRRWRLFIVVLLSIALSFLIIVALQGDQNLRPAFELGLAFVGAATGMFIYPPSKKFTGIVSRQLGFILASLALVGLVKSLTAFVLLVPITPLVIPAARGSMAFARTAEVSASKPGIISRLAERYVGSKEIGIGLLYASLSYLGLASAWFLHKPGLIQSATLLSGAFVLPSLFVLTNKTIDYLEDWQPDISREGSKRGTIFGTTFNAIDLKRTKEKLLELTGSKKTNYVATPDVTAVIRAENDEFLEGAFTRADVVTPDGFGLIWAANVHGLPLRSRVAGIDILEEIFQADQEITAYLLGSRPGVAEKAGENITRDYENVEICGSHHGYISNGDCKSVIAEINEENPDLLLVGMGVPKQENWIIENLEKVDAKVVMGVGGSFDVISGNLPRAPRWMREKGLEWLYRIRLEPRRLTKARLIPYFMAKVYWEKAKLSLRKEIL
ncbi:WecB/TagA/CpsF family glycosyltransferase [Candidatus Bipolaricaulota bacterium]|nr:WecB/TagA/CpsF family glycosyltransferase [Candidatus Bipolaricaulota bacterium]